MRSTTVTFSMAFRVRNQTNSLYQFYQQSFIGLLGTEHWHFKHFFIAIRDGVFLMDPHFLYDDTEVNWKDQKDKNSLQQVLFFRSLLPYPAWCLLMSWMVLKSFYLEAKMLSALRGIFASSLRSLLPLLEVIFLENS